jgi:hypothetical protein
MYASGDATLDWINQQRDACGAGALAKSSALQTIAASHSGYLEANGLGPSHTQSPSLPGYTGNRIGDRATAAGYSWSLAIEGVATYAATELVGARTLMAMPYHRIALLDHRLDDVGIALVRAERGINRGLGLTVVAASLQASAKPQGLKASAASCIYPADGAVDVGTIGLNEFPNPVPELGAWGQPSLPGYPISIQIPANQTLSVTGFQLKESSGRVVPVKIIDRTDPIKLAADNIKHWAFAVPLEPLKSGTTYSVSFVGSAEGKPVERSWSFTTRPATVAVESTKATSNGTIVLLRSPADYLQMGSITTGNGCAAGASFAAAAGGVELVLYPNSAVSAGCEVRFNAIEPVSRKEVQLLVKL